MMSDNSFRPMVFEESPDGTFFRQIQTRRISDLPKGNVLIKVDYSYLNDKDALSAVGNKGVSRRYPHTPGIDAAGVVEHSEDDSFSRGDSVRVTGYDLEMNTSGGFGQFWPIYEDANIHSCDHWRDCNISPMGYNPNGHKNWFFGLLIDRVRLRPSAFSAANETTINLEQTWVSNVRFRYHN